MIDVNPMSVNAAWQGRRRKTSRYLEYEAYLLDVLPNAYTVPPEGDLVGLFHWGLSSIAFDWDNPIKPLQDILQKKYNFDDRRIFKAVVSKEKVDKGHEFITFDFFPLEQVKISVELLPKTVTTSGGIEFPLDPYCSAGRYI